MAATAYSYYVIAKDAAGNASAASNSVTVNTPALVISYCASSGSSTIREYINKVEFGSISNLSGNNGGYGNYTSLSTDLALGSSNSITIVPSWTTRSTYAEAYCVWIDFNQDGDFNDSDEQVINQSKSKVSTFSGKIVVPTTALLGTTRMRVSMKYNAFPTPCETFTYGEVEDYTVTFTASGRFDEETIDTKPAIVIYPNPVKGDQLNISNLENKATFTIYNMTGQVIARNSIENETVYVGSLPTGAYLIEIINGNTRVTKHFIKE